MFPFGGTPPPQAVPLPFQGRFSKGEGKKAPLKGELAREA